MKEKKVDEVSRLMRDVHFLHFKKTYSKFKDIGVHPGQARMLELIKKNPGITVTEIMREIGREKATIATSLKRLESSGFIYKEASKTDKRSYKNYVTESGERIVNNFDKLKCEEMKDMSKILSVSDLDNILEIMNKIKTALIEEDKK